MKIMSSFGKRGVKHNLLSKKVDIEDGLDSSKYFDIVELDTVFTAGRNPVSFNGSSFLQSGSEILIECLDSAGSPLYFEQARSKKAQFSDVAKFVIAIHVYNETANGPAKLIFSGTTIDGKSVRWSRQISIDKTLTNAKKVRFYDMPELELRPLLYPVVDLNLASDFDQTLYQDAQAISHIDTKILSVGFYGNSTGSGYSTPPSVQFISSTGTGATAYVSALTSNGGIASVVVSNGGTGYTSAPTIQFSGGGTPTSIPSAYVDRQTYIYSASVTNPGAGYDASDPPAVTFQNNGGGTGATAQPDIEEGGVVRIQMTAGGSGYISAPTIEIESSKPTLASELNVPVNFSSPFYAFAVTPPFDTNRLLIDKKRIDVDYRLVITGESEAARDPSLYPTGSFNTQMEGQDIELSITRIKKPLTHNEIDVSITETFKVKKVLDHSTILLSDPFYYKRGNNTFIANIVSGVCSVSYNFIKYNTNPDSSLSVTPTNSTASVNVKESYVEATYRNIKPFSGFVARHKLYRRSLFYPGEFQQVSDEPLNVQELLIDQITFNRSYYQIGKLYHQLHIDKYWFPSSEEITLSARNNPINSMYISCGSPDQADGSKYVMVKTDTLGGTNDNRYYPYVENEFNQLSGSSYNSNFINLKKNALHLLSFGVSIEKARAARDAKLSFYFTSSVAEIRNEKAYDPSHGLKLGEISITDNSIIKYFDKQPEMYFTPENDYYGTLKIVPFHCNAIISDISLKAYGDSGFSPEVLTIRVPCPLNVANEAFEFKAELYDINHILIPTNLTATQVFDQTGESLYATDGFGQVFEIQDGGDTIISTTETFIVNGEIKMPNLDPDCEIRDTDRIVKWDGRDGSLKRTNVVGLRFDDEYVVLRTGSCEIGGLTPTEGKSVNVRFDGITGGRQIYWIDGTTKQIDLSI